MVDGLTLDGMHQYVSEPTRGENILDLVFCKVAHSVTFVRPGVFESDHCEIACIFRVHTRKHSVINRTTALNYKRADFQGMRRTLELLPWNVLKEGDIDAAVDTFYAFLDATIRDHIPTVVLRKGYPP